MQIHLVDLVEMSDAAALDISILWHIQESCISLPSA